MNHGEVEDSMELIQLLNIDRRQGPPTEFHPWHLLAAFYTFCQSTAPIGRYHLGPELGLGGGSIRSLIRFLRKQGLIEPIQRQGHHLSKEGHRHCAILNRILVKLVELPESSYTIDICNFGCHLHQCAKFVTDGVQQRDAAMHAGASGATTFIQDSDPEALIMVKEHRVPKTQLKNTLERFNIKDGDVLIIGTGPTKISAKLGTFAAILTLLEKW